MELIYPFSSSLHALASVVWVGGMFFAHMVLRPSLMTFDPPDRLSVWAEVLPRFFKWVWAAVILLPLTGYMMVGVDFGSIANAGMHVGVMHLLSWIMTGLFAFLYFVPFKQFRTHVGNTNWPEAAKSLAVVRGIVTTNLVFGLAQIVIGISGPFWGVTSYVP